MIFFDIDGTLWDEKHIIPDSTLEAMSLLKKNGHKRLICSGRSKSFIQNDSLLQMDFDGFITGCGTLVEYEEKKVASYVCDNALLAKAIEIGNECGMISILEGEDYMYMDKEDWVTDDYAQYIIKVMGENLLSLKDNWGKWENINKFCATTTDADIDRAFPLIEEHFNILVHNGDYVEILPKGYDKGVGIDIIIDHLGILRKETYAFGDSINDVEMLSAAGTGIVMGNAPKKIHQYGDYVTDKIKEDGIYNACKHFGLI